jgi:hypothetical protein
MVAHQFDEYAGVDFARFAKEEQTAQLEVAHDQLIQNTLVSEKHLEGHHCSSKAHVKPELQHRLHLILALLTLIGSVAVYNDPLCAHNIAGCTQRPDVVGATMSLWIIAMA